MNTAGTTNFPSQIEGNPPIQINILDDVSLMDGLDEGRKKRGLPLIVKTLSIIVVGCIFLGLPALIDYLVNIKHNQPTTGKLIKIKDYLSPWEIGGYSIFCWSIFCCILWVEFWGIHYIVNILPDFLLRLIALFVGSQTERVEKYINFLRVLKRNIIFFLFMMVLLITFNQTLTGNASTDLFNFSGTNSGNSSNTATTAIGNAGSIPIVFSNGTNVTSASGVDSLAENEALSQSEYKWQEVVNKLIICIYFFSICWLIQKLLLQLFAVDFHKNTFQERMYINKDAMKTLTVLNEARKKAIIIQQRLNAHSSPKSKQQKPKGHIFSTISNNFQNLTTPLAQTANTVTSMSTPNLNQSLANNTVELKSTEHNSSPVVNMNNGVDQDSKNVNTISWSNLKTPTVTTENAIPKSEQQKETLQKHCKVTCSAFDFALEIGHRAAMVMSTAVGIEIDNNKKFEAKQHIDPSDVRTKQDAKVFAYSLYEALLICREQTSVNKQDGILLPDFLALFATKEDAKYAFSLFDRNSSGNISKKEFKDTVQEIYEEKWGLEKSLLSSNAAIMKLDSFLFNIVVIVSVFVSLGIWNVNVDALLGSVAAIWLGIAFAVGDTFTKLFSNLIFIFISHPFDCGDLIEYEKDQYVVKEFYTMHTLLVRYDGKHVYAPNYELSQSILANNRRSAPLRDEITLTCVFETATQNRIQLLQQALDEFTLMNSEDYIPNQGLKETISSNQNASPGNIKGVRWRNVGSLQPFEPYGVYIFFDSVVQSGKVKLTIVYYHKTNGQNRLRAQVRRSKFNAAVLDAMDIIGIDIDNNLQFDITLFEQNSLSYRPRKS